MEISDLVSIGASLFKDKIGGENIDSDAISNALSGLVSNSEGGLDLSNIMSSLSDGNIGSIISSWVGSGENEAIDGEGLSSLLGSDKISEFADMLGIDTDTALSGLQGALPDMIDKATGDGSGILDSLGGVDGLMDMANKFFK